MRKTLSRAVAGAILVADSGNARLVVYDGGEPGRQYAASRTPSADAMKAMDMDMPLQGSPGNEHLLFAYPSDVALAADGTLYVSNTHHYEILVFDADLAIGDDGRLCTADFAASRVQCFNIVGAQ